MKPRNKPLPSLSTDAQAESFVAKADLSTYDLSGFKPRHFALEPKSAALRVRLPQSLLEALKGKAKAQGMPYTHYVRMLLETDLGQPR